LDDELKKLLMNDEDYSLTRMKSVVDVKMMMMMRKVVEMEIIYDV
jgi:hypothetical protein